WRRLQGQLPEEVRPARLHARTDAGPALADSRRGAPVMEAQVPLRLILASGSPARRYLLSRAGYQFEIKPARIDEPSGAGVIDPRSYVQSVAWLKAASVAPQVDSGLVLSADTVGWLQGEVIGKPEDEADARRILRFLGGKEHELWTGVCLWQRPGDVQIAWQEVTCVFFQQLSDAEIDRY